MSNSTLQDIAVADYPKKMLESPNSPNNGQYFSIFLIKLFSLKIWDFQLCRTFITILKYYLEKGMRYLKFLIQQSLKSSNIYIFFIWIQFLPILLENLTILQDSVVLIKCLSWIHVYIFLFECLTFCILQNFVISFFGRLMEYPRKLFTEFIFSNRNGERKLFLSFLVHCSYPFITDL